MTGDHNEKYFRLNLDWPNKAGKLSQVLAAQKRLVTKLAGRKQDEDVKALLLLVAEGHTVTTDLLTYVHTTLQEVGKDAEALWTGSKLRNQLDWAQQLNTELLAAEYPQYKK